MVNDRPEDANYKLELKSLKSAFEVGNSGQHYTPTYNSVYKSVPSQTKPSSTSMAETIIRPSMAGTRETEDYSASFNKEKLGSLKSMFEQKKQGSSDAGPKKFVPDFTRGSSGVGKVASSSANNPNERDPSVIYSVAGEREKVEYKPTVSLSAARSMFEQKKPAEYQPKNKVKPSVGKIVIPKMGGDNEQEVAKNSESVDDRPKELTTSLLSARAMFEGGNRASDASIVKEVASWDGKGNSDVLGSAKAVFSSGDAGENQQKPKSPEPVQLVEEPVVEEPVAEEPVVEEPVVEKSVVDEPVVEEPVVEEPVVEEPVVEEQTVEEPSVKEVVEEQVVEEPTFEEPEIIEQKIEVERVETPETPVVEHLQEEIVEQEQEATQTPTEEEEEVLPETLCTTTANPEVVEQPTTVEQHSEATTQPSVLEIDETAPNTVEPSPEVEEMKATLEVNSPENAALQPSPAKNAGVKVNSTNQSKDDDYDSSDVLSDGATTTSQEGEQNQK
jgi:hypothetical protein